MAENTSSASETEDELLRHAVAVLRRRYQDGGRYSELQPPAAAELGDILAGIADGDQSVKGVDREEAVALAHRLIDDDHPELSPMWPGSTG